MAKSAKTKVKSLKQMLASDQPETVDAGLSLLESLSDAAIADELLDKVDYVLDCIYGRLIPNNHFKGKPAEQPLRNHALLGVIRYAPEDSAKAKDLRTKITSLGIDTPYLTHLCGLPNLRTLKLYDSLKTLKDLKGIESCKGITRLDISGCQEIESISDIEPLPIDTFLFKRCKRLSSLEALKGKRDATATRLLDLRDFSELSSLEGIEFYQSLEVVLLDCNYALKRFVPLRDLPEFKYVTREHWLSQYQSNLSESLSTDGLITAESKEALFHLKEWSYEKPIRSDNLHRVKLGCESMRDINWLSHFPSAQILHFRSKDLDNLEGLAGYSRIHELVIKDAAITNVDALANKRIDTLELEGCRSLKNLDGLASVKGLKKVSIQYCESLEDIAGLYECVDRMNKKPIIEIQGCPVLKRVGSIATSPGLRRYKITGSFHDEQIACLRNAPDLELIVVNSNEVDSELGGEPLPFRLKFDCGENFRLSGTGYRHVSLLNLESKDLTPLSKLPNLESLIVSEAESLTSLDGIGTSKGLKELRIEKAPLLKSIEELRHLKELRHLSLRNCESVRDVSVLMELPNLQTLDLTGCKKLNIRPPSLSLWPREVLDYRRRNLSTVGKPTDETQESKTADMQSKGGEAVTDELFERVRKMLGSMDYREIDDTVEWMRSLNSEKVFDEILSGTDHGDSRIFNDGLFRGTALLQPFMDHALLKILEAASAYGTWSQFSSKIRELKVENAEGLGFGNFTKLEKLEIDTKYGVIGTISIPTLKIFVASGLDSFDPGSLAGCTFLEYLSVETKSVKNGLLGLGSLTKLKTFKLTHTDNRIDCLSPIASCAGLETLVLEYEGEGAWSPGDVGIISQLSCLRVLDFHDCHFEDSRFLKGLTRLEYLVIYKNESLTELHLPEDGSALENISINECPSMKKIRPGSLPRQLERLHITGTDIESIPKLSGLDTVYDFSINYNEHLTELEGLSGLVFINDLYELSLDGCPNIKDLSGISKLRISRLSLSTPELPAGELPHVAILKLFNTKSIKGIGRFTGLRYLEIVPNEELGDLKDIGEAVRLVGLKIQKCTNIRSLAGLEHLKELDYINMVDLKSLKDIDAVKDLTISQMLIAGSNFKKGDFPLHLQPGIDWATKPW